MSRVLFILLFISISVISCSKNREENNLETKESDLNIITKEKTKGEEISKVTINGNLNSNDSNENISSEQAETIISKKAEKIINIIAEKNFQELSKYIHPVNGAFFSTLNRFSINSNLKFYVEDIHNFLDNQKVYRWGGIPGSAIPIELNPPDYFDRYIYNNDYINADKIGYNQMFSDPDYQENQHDVFEKAIVVEFYIEQNEHKLDESTRIVFQEYEGEWYIVGFSHYEWTI